MASEKCRILISNDDGIGSPGIRVELLLPLFNGCRATVSASQLVRA